jgi:tRNA threonylcarbamoyl adenosine modification protein (Sua5/YciO/YrdC/YwlC family)
LVNHVYTYINPIKEKDIEAAVTVLENDGVLAILLDVSWSFICYAGSSKALDRIHRIKPFHPKTQPFSLVTHSISAAAQLVNIGTSEYRLLKRIMPGPYTVLLERHVSLPKQIHDKRKIVGIRIPDSPLFQALSERFVKPIAASTVASLASDSEEFGAEMPVFGWEIAERYGHGIDMILDLGNESSRLQTTIVDLTSGTPVLIRQGAGVFDDLG